MLLCLWFAIALLARPARAAHILGYFNFPSFSHQAVYLALCRELALRGHQVTVLTPNPLNDATVPNLVEVDLSTSYQFVRLQEQMPPHASQRQLHTSVFALTATIFEHQMQNEHVQRLVRDSDRHFDLVLIEAFFPFAYAFAAHYNCPVIGMASLDFFNNAHLAVGNPVHPVLYPNLLFPTTYEHLSLFDRAHSLLTTLWHWWWYEFTVLPQSERLAQKYFPNTTLRLRDVERNVSMIFVNTDPVIHVARSNVPAVVTMGMMHIRPPKKLPKDLQEFLDGASEGAVYLSLGSNVKSSNLPPATLAKIAAAVAALPFRVVWKWEAAAVHLQDRPGNVLTRPWLPQQDLLAHPNVRVFVSQGGLQSIEEAVVRGVPVVGMPFIADQPANVRRLADFGAAIHVDPFAFEAEQLRAAIVEVATNPRYRAKVAELRDIILDQPMSGMEKAVFWAEYVLRHNGAKHLRSPAADIHFYKYYFIDVLAAFVTVLYILFKFFRYFISKLLRFIVFNKTKTD